MSPAARRFSSSERQLLFEGYKPAAPAGHSSDPSRLRWPAIVDMTLAILPARRETSSIGLSAPGVLPFVDSARASVAMRALVAIVRLTASTKARVAASASATARECSSFYRYVAADILRASSTLRGISS